MEYLLLKAATTATAERADQGLFEAVISTSAVDREGDVVDPGGMVRALKRWVPTGKMLPLTWHHSVKSQDICGYVDPNTARSVGDEVLATGWIDQTTPIGQNAWRLVKQRSLGFSFGYLTLDGEPRREGKGRNLRELDVFEITITPTPMNPQTRVLGWKAADVDDQRGRADAIAREADDQTIPTDLPAETFEQAPEPERPEAPGMESQWRKATDYEREQTAARRRAEEAELPDLGPEPLAERVERRSASAPPDPDEQRRKAAVLAQEQARTRRRAEEAALPSVQPAPPDPPAPPRRDRLPDVQEQWVKAVALERELEAEGREREQAQIPDVPPEPPTGPGPGPVRVPDAKSQRLRAREVERELAAEAREVSEGRIPDLADEPIVEVKEAPAPSIVPDDQGQRRKAAAVERWASEVDRRDTANRMAEIETKMTAEPFSTSKTSNWVARGGGLPHYIQHIAHDLMEKRGMDESRAIQMAIGICKRWARGGANVTAKTRAEAAAAIAEWEALRARAHAKPKALDTDEPPDPEDMEAQLYELPPEEMLALLEVAMAVDGAPPVADQREKATQYERETIRELEDGLTAPRLADVVGLEDDELRTIINQSEISPDVKGRLGAVLDGRQLASETDSAHRAQAVNLLRERANAVELEHASGGESTRKPPQEEKVAPPRRPSLPLKELQRKARDEIIIALSGLDDA